MATLKLTNNIPMDIPVTQMKDGDLAVITAWWSDAKATYVGIIVHRYKGVLVAVGKESGRCWTGLFDGPTINEFRVRPLQKGDTLVIE